MCVQKDQLNSKEDCLYLNVLAPRNITSSSSLPVMVYIHGGGLRYIYLIIYICIKNEYFENFLRAGSASSTSFRNLAVSHNIITVSIQYRLFVHGFFSLGIEEASGNQGLLDQSLALKWVYDNIKYFGGDNKRISLGGGSAGSQSV
jgi:carboxylesterase type B